MTVLGGTVKLAAENEQGQDTPSESDASNWTCLCRIGGIAAFVLIVYSLLTIVQLIVLGGPPATAAEAFRLLQGNRIVGLLRLDLPTIVAMPLYYFVFLGLFAALKRTDVANAILSTALAFVGVTLLLATPTALSMISLSQEVCGRHHRERHELQFLAAGRSDIGHRHLAWDWRHHGWNPRAERRCADLRRNASSQRFQTGQPLT